MYPWFDSGRCHVTPGQVAPCRSCCNTFRTCRSWPDISVVARRFRTPLLILANSVTTAPIITSVMAIATSISISVNAPHLRNVNPTNPPVSPRLCRGFFPESRLAVVANPRQSRGLTNLNSSRTIVERNIRKVLSTRAAAPTTLLFHLHYVAAKRKGRGFLPQRPGSTDHG